MKTVIYGSSDDLIEVEGGIREEFASDQDTTTYFGFSNGVVVRVTCDEEGTWRLTPVACPSLVEIVFARGEDSDRDEDGCPGYSDKAVIASHVEWVVAGTEWAKR